MVQQYTQSGSAGASDGEARFSDQRRAESDGSGEAATHTHTHSVDSSGSRTGSTELRGRRLSKIEEKQKSGRYVHGLLAVAMSGECERHGSEANSYNPDPKVADYENAEAVFELFLNACK